MNIQVYLLKRNFDVQKAERFFKERRIPFQLVDLKKHQLGERELRTFARGRGVKALVDRESEAVRSHPVAYTEDENVILEYLLQNPAFLRLPIVRNGNECTVGADENVWKSWID